MDMGILRVSEGRYTGGEPGWVPSETFPEAGFEARASDARSARLWEWSFKI